MIKFHANNFKVIFRAVYTILVSVWTGAYLWHVTFSKPNEVAKYAEFIIGFILGTLIATLINFYYGGNEDATKNPESDDGPFDFSTSGKHARLSDAKPKDLSGDGT